MQKVGGPSPLSPTSFHGPGLRATPARTLSRPTPGPSREASERPVWRSASPRCEAKGLPPRSAKSPRFYSNAEIRRQRGGARIRFAPPGRKGRSRVRPILADSAARPARPIPPKSTNIFLKISIFNFHIFPIPHGELPQPRFARQPPLGGGRPGSGRHRETSPSPRLHRPPPRGGWREAPGGVLRAPPVPRPPFPVHPALRRPPVPRPPFPVPRPARPTPGPSQETSERPVWRSASPRREAKGLPPRSAKSPRSFSTRGGAGRGRADTALARGRERC